jgi:hypothetical protein
MRRLRERRAVALLPVDGRAPLAEADRLAPAVEETLAALELGERDAAAAQVARQYARVMDEARDQAWALRWIGPLLLGVLEELGATPASRARLQAQRPAAAGPSQLDRLRAARARSSRPSRL